jgi:hypothetical protein
MAQEVKYSTTMVITLDSLQCANQVEHNVEYCIPRHGQSQMVA